MRYLTGTLLWLVLLPVVGSVRFLLLVFRLAAFMQPRTQMALMGLIVLISTANPVTDELRLHWSEPVWQLFWSWLWLTVGLAVLFCGLRSKESQKLWRIVWRTNTGRKTSQQRRPEF